MDALNLRKKIENAEREIEYLKSKLDTVYPAPIKEFYEYLMNAWNRQDERLRGMYKREIRTLGEDEFKKNHSSADYSLAYTTKRQIAVQNEALAQETVNSLYERLRDVSGEDIDYSGLTFSVGELTGTVKGSKGISSVRVIIVGGYNIQKIHVRFFIKLIEE
jgi:hypothetical protein